MPIPYLIESRDLLFIEVLEALPGRPISGERLVKPDGTISLGFYGSVHVSGLTEEQAKAKILLHLRTYLSDDYLGLYKLKLDENGLPVSDESNAVEPALSLAQCEDAMTLPEPPPAIGMELPGLPPPIVDDRLDSQKREKTSSPLRNARRRRRSAHQRRPKRSGSERPTPLRAPRGQREEIPPDGSKADDSETTRSPNQPVETLPSDSVNLEDIDPGSMDTVHPADSDRIFVDVSGYNTKAYYVIGDVAEPGRMPYTGYETVLDALNFSGGFIATADPKNVRLIRPSHGDQPARIYRIDYEAITEKGDSKANYQIFPGDRIVVGRNDVVKKSIEIDRLAAPLQTIFNSMLQYSFMVASMKPLASSPTGPGQGAPTVSQAKRDAMLKVWADFWSEAMAETGGVKLDEKRLREALLRAMETSAKEGESTDSKAK